MTRDGWTDTGEILGREYIKLYCQYKAYHRKEKQKWLMLRDSASSAGVEVNSTVINSTITQERRAPDTGDSTSMIFCQIVMKRT